MTPPVETEEVTLAVVVSKLEGITGQISDLSKKMDDRPTWQDVRNIEKGIEAKITAQVALRTAVTGALAADVTRLESWQQWAGRLVMGAIGTGVLAAVFVVRP
ncbi:hypothetical protein [Arthrobacter sp. GMC3]|uniref:hypothetical protein n=1 Tax=Arthrobacter sp. GMC3 TaxID=2058894 RepID=UPI000CE2C36E|nr:hypothetical protein [Arthrobacter sp. GMC3]